MLPKTQFSNLTALIVIAITALLLALVALSAKNTFAAYYDVSGPTPLTQGDVMEYSMIRVAYASDDWDEPEVISRRVVAERPADTVYKAKAEVQDDQSISSKAVVFRGKEKRGFFSRLFGSKKSSGSDAAFNAKLGFTKSIKDLSTENEVGLADNSDAAATLASDSTTLASSVLTSEVDWKANEHKISRAAGAAKKVAGQKVDPFALSAAQKKTLGLESSVNYEADLIQALGLGAGSAESAKIKKSLKTDPTTAVDHSISSDQKALIAEIELLKMQEAQTKKVKDLAERQKEARRLLQVKRELMLEIHEQKKAKASARSRAEKVGLLDDWDYDGIVTSKDRKYSKRRKFKKERTPYNLQDSYEDYNVFEDKGWEYEEGSSRIYKKSRSKKSRSKNYDDWD